MSPSDSEAGRCRRHTRVRNKDLKSPTSNESAAVPFHMLTIIRLYFTGEIFILQRLVMAMFKLEESRNTIYVVQSYVVKKTNVLSNAITRHCKAGQDADGNLWFVDSLQLIVLQVTPPVEHGRGRSRIILEHAQAPPSLCHPIARWSASC